MVDNKFQNWEYFNDKFKSYSPSVSDSAEVKKDSAATINTIFGPELVTKSSDSTAINLSQSSKGFEVQAKTMFGHLAYAQADDSTLTTLAFNKNIKGNKNAVGALDKMTNDAKKEGINLTVISGFRSVERQKHLFYGIAQERGETPEREQNYLPRQNLVNIIQDTLLTLVLMVKAN